MGRGWQGRGEEEGCGEENKKERKEGSIYRLLLEIKKAHAMPCHTAWWHAFPQRQRNISTSGERSLQACSRKDGEGEEKQCGSLAGSRRRRKLGPGTGRAGMAWGTMVSL